MIYLICIESLCCLEVLRECSVMRNGVVSMEESWFKINPRAVPSSIPPYHRHNQMVRNGIHL